MIKPDLDTRSAIVAHFTRKRLLEVIDEIFVALLMAICLLNKPAWSDDSKKIKIGDLLCNTTLERMVYDDGSGDNYFRLDDQPIRSAKITIYDIKKFPNLLFIEFHSP